MNQKLTLALGAAALSAILAQPAQAGHPEIYIGLGIQPPAVAVAVPPPPPVVAYTYRYYPRQQVYFDPARGLYFWYERGSWLWGPSLPSYIVLGPRYQPLTLAGPWPYHYHQEIYRRYPPHWASRGPWRD